MNRSKNAEEIAYARCQILGPLLQAEMDPASAPTRSERWPSNTNSSEAEPSEGGCRAMRRTGFAAS